MRLCAALAVVLVALLVVTVRGLRRPPKRPPTTEVDIAAIDPPETAAPRPTSAAPIRRESEGAAHLRGRVLFPAGVEVTEDLEVAAEDATRRVIARITDDGRFDIHLPSGRYTLVASAGLLVGVVPDVLVRSGAERDVDIRLATGAAIRGKVRAPNGVDCDVGISAVPTGRDDEIGKAETDDDRFSINGLVAGRQYDLTFRCPELRKLTLTAVSAPADGLDVALQPRPELRGAIGLTPDGDCPISTVALQVSGKTMTDQDENDASTDVGDDCSFMLAVPDQVATVTLVATGDGWHLEEQVAIPPNGDPEPICLNPPCRSEPEQELARLQLTMDGAPAPQEFSATVVADDLVSIRHRVHSCSSDESTCRMEGLKAGATYRITASGIACRAAPRHVTLARGDNQVRIPCIRQRQIEGVVRIPAGEWLDGVSVRCPGGDDMRALSGTRLFALTCNADARAVEYQIGAEGTWRSVPVASAENLTFVEIGPL
jgi:hypothetical protein